MKNKFRAWDGNKMIKDFFISQEGKIVINIQYDGLNYYDYPLMQFIGIKDRHGKEIYEGDIISVFREDSYSSQNKGIIVYEYGRYGFYTNGKISKKAWVNIFDWSINEILGNIFENSDLRKKYTHGNEQTKDEIC